MQIETTNSDSIKIAISDKPNGEIVPNTLTPVSLKIDSFGDNNDIYQRIYEQTCSGNRGNICSGNVSDYWELNVSCENKKDYERETCFGPCSPNDNNCSEYNYLIDSPRSCYAYDHGQSFEQDFQKNSTASGVCNEVWKCASTTGSKRYNKKNTT